MVAASDVTKRRPRWLITSLFLPGETADDEKHGFFFEKKRRAVWTKTSPDEIGELNDSLDIPEGGLVYALKIFVAILEDLDAVCVWDLEGHG
jgi:hypothetical protein